MHRIAPPWHAPALLATCPTLLEIRELPKVVHDIEVADLREPCSHAWNYVSTVSPWIGKLKGKLTFHHLSPCSQTLLPMCLPLEQVARVECVRAQLKDTTQLSWRGRRPEPELLHQRRLLAGDELLKLAVELGELGVILDRVKRSMVAGITLVLPDVDCSIALSAVHQSHHISKVSTHQNYHNLPPRSSSCRPDAPCSPPYWPCVDTTRRRA